MTLITLHDYSENDFPSMVDTDKVVGIQHEGQSPEPFKMGTFVMETTVGNFSACWNDVVKLFKETGEPMVLLQEFYEKDFEIAVRDGVYGDREHYGRKFTKEQLINNARSMLRCLTAELELKRKLIIPELNERISKGESMFRHLPSTMDMLIEAVPKAALVDNWAWNDKSASVLISLHDERCQEGHFPGFKVGDKTKDYYKALNYFKEFIESQTKNTKERSK